MKTHPTLNIPRCRTFRNSVVVVAQISISDCTDIIVDTSALSRGVTFPIVKFLLENSQGKNVHAFMMDDPAADEEICPVVWEQASSIHGFRGSLGSVSDLKPARLWLPQLVRGQNAALDLIYKMVQPHDVLSHPSFSGIRPPTARSFD